MDKYDADDQVQSLSWFPGSVPFSMKGDGGIIGMASPVGRHR
jgi:hypothetical protein